MDAQLKVRGFRVEPAEVEAVLGAADGVSRVVVDARTVSGSDVLVAWVQLTADAAAAGLQTASTLRAFALQKLPEWLVPTLVLVVEEIAETAAGKVDRARLPDPSADLLAGGAPPETPTEAEVAAVWAELLGRPTVPVDQSFFLLGGQSLLAARMVARVREELDVDLDLRDVLAAPRVRDIALLVDADRSQDRADRARTGSADGAQPLDELLADVDQLTDAQVEALLAGLGEK